MKHIEHIGEVLERLRQRGHLVEGNVLLRHPAGEHLYYGIDARWLTEEEVRALVEAMSQGATP